ncbi:MAG: UDP-N-acetylmuramate dehydrogenase [Muribaculaceae bacterium]|nr:UDP-N-acetylmuramate dehydrogenase [Muribaculaceae bacterium]
MIEIIENKDITSFTTFGIPVKARYFAEYSSERELLALSRKEEFLNNQVLHIGGGSNLVFLSDFNGLVLHSGIKGIQEYRKDDDTVFAIVGAGEKWTDFVDWCIERNLAGVENLAHIPGEAGASAIQNVGAYGVEAGDLIHAVECFDTETRKTVRFSREECRFGYRDSMFKHEGKGRYFVLRVSFRLYPDGKARNLTYGPLKELEARLGHYPSIKEVADEVTKIRDSKLPDPAVIGSAGSFFKNPVIHRSMYEKLCEMHPGLPGYPAGDDMVKVSAAWMIDKAGMKGYRIGGAEVYDKQPLVLINAGGATGEDVRKLADKVIRKVRSDFYLTLKPEANFIDTDITVTVLGSGTSKGVPEMGCECRVCSSTDSHDKRLRASVLVETAGLRLLIDPSPDLRQQALRIGLADIDAVLVTHNHYDHVGGFDDLRPFCSNSDLPVYLRHDVDADLRRRLDYCFRPNPYPGVPTFEMNIIDNKPFYINGVKIEPIEVLHGKLPIYGYRIGNFAYVTDAKYISEEEKEKLKNLEVLILNSLRDKPHFAHLSFSEAMSLIEEVKPARTYLTHFGHEAGLHEELEARTPDNVHPAYDGMVIKVNKF